MSLKRDLRFYQDNLIAIEAFPDGFLPEVNTNRQRYVRLVVSLRAVAWAWSQPAVQAQMRRDPTLLHYTASIARCKCKNAFGVKTITVMLREVAASVRLVTVYMTDSPPSIRSDERTKGA